jgi:hypothetical protein
MVHDAPLSEKSRSRGNPPPTEVRANVWSALGGNPIAQSAASGPLRGDEAIPMIGGRR